MNSNAYYDYQIARKSSDIMSLIKKKTGVFTTEEIVTDVFNISRTNHQFNQYWNGVELFLKSNKDFMRMQSGIWSYRSQNEVRFSGTVQKEKLEEVQTITYAERVKGFIKVSQTMASNTEIKHDKQGSLDVLYEGCCYEFYWKWRYNHCYLVGNGVMDFFADAALHPNQAIVFKLENKQLEITIPKQTIEHVNQIPHVQLHQIEESIQQDGDRPIFPILCELLSTFPGGLTLKEIFQQFLEYKMATSDEIHNIMKQNECFEQDEDELWFVQVNKISRYYKNEHGLPAEHLLTYSWLVGEEIETGSKAIPDQPSPQQSIPHKIEEHHEAPTSTTQQGEFPFDSIIQNLNSLSISPRKIKEEIDVLVIECFNKGEIEVLASTYRDAQNIYAYFTKMEQFLTKWKGQVL